MNRSIPPPLHVEFDESFRDLFRNGDQKGVCAQLDRDPSQLSNELNHEKPEKSDAYRFARFLWACYSTRQELGAAVWAFMEAFNGQFQAKDRALNTSGVLREMFDVFKVLSDENAEPTAKTQAANKGIELLEGFKYGLCLQTGEGYPAARAGR